MISLTCTVAEQSQFGMKMHAVPVDAFWGAVCCFWHYVNRWMQSKRRKHFCVGLWGLDDLDDPETAAVLQQAQEQPDLFVLKPQREGGGNNLYGEAAQQKLQTRKGLSAYILMQRIRPPINR